MITYYTIFKPKMNLVIMYLKNSEMYKFLYQYLSQMITHTTPNKDSYELGFILKPGQAYLLYKNR